MLAGRLRYLLLLLLEQLLERRVILKGVDVFEAAVESPLKLLKRSSNGL